MECPRCKQPRSRVNYTRSRVDPGTIYRRRRCQNPDCRATFRTFERLDPRDDCRGRRPGEPRKVRGRPRIGPGKPPPPVELPDFAQDPPPEWKKKFTEALPKLPSLEELRLGAREPFQRCRSEEPRGDLEQPGTADIGLRGPPPVVELPEVAAVDQPKERELALAMPEEPPADWREQFLEAVKKLPHDLGLPRERIR